MGSGYGRMEERAAAIMAGKSVALQERDGKPVVKRETPMCEAYTNTPGAPGCNGSLSCKANIHSIGCGSLSR